MKHLAISIICWAFCQRLSLYCSRPPSSFYSICKLEVLTLILQFCCAHMIIYSNSLEAVSVEDGVRRHAYSPHTLRSCSARPQLRAVGHLAGPSMQMSEGFTVYPSFDFPDCTETWTSTLHFQSQLCFSDLWGILDPSFPSFHSFLLISSHCSRAQPFPFSNPIRSLRPSSILCMQQGSGDSSSEILTGSAHINSMGGAGRSE